MDQAALREEFERHWQPWMAALDAIPPEATRQPGVCGSWTLHDVVGHVQAYVRYHLVQARAAWTHVVPSVEDVMGGRGEMGPDGGSLHRRNEGLRLAGLSLSWQQLVDEAAWLRIQTVDWVDVLSGEDLEEPVGWVEFWNPAFPRPDDLPLHVRRTREVPAAFAPMPLWQFLLPDKPPGHHVSEHLEHARAWLRACRTGRPSDGPGSRAT